MIKRALVLAVSFLGTVYVSGFHSAGGDQPGDSTASAVAPAPASAPQSGRAHTADTVRKKGSRGADQSVHPYKDYPAKRWPWEDMPYVVRQPKEGC